MSDNTPITIPDNTPPTLTLNGKSTVSISAGNSYSDAGATCKDTVDGTIQPTVQGAVKSSIPGTYTLTYFCSDDAGNSAVSISRTIKVSDTSKTSQPNTPTSSSRISPPTTLPLTTTSPPDVIPPSLTLNGHSIISISTNSSYTDAGASCTDNIDGTIQPTVQDAVDYSVPGTYALTYFCSDDAGNSAVPVSRTIKVFDALNGDYDETCTDGKYPIQGVKTDAVYQDYIKISWTALNCPGDYVVRYWETDNRTRTVQQSLVPAGQSTFTATGLLSETEYTFRIMYDEPDDSITTSFWKNSAPHRVTTYSSNPQLCLVHDITPSNVSLSDILQPSGYTQYTPTRDLVVNAEFSITDVNAVTIGHDTIQISWLSNNCIGNYAVSYWKTENITGTFTMKHPENSTCANVDGLEPDTEYTFSLSYKNAANSTAQFESDLLKVATTPVLEPISTDVIDMQANMTDSSTNNFKFDIAEIHVNATTANLLWTEPNCPGDYKVRYWETADLMETFKVADVLPGYNNFTATGLEPDTEYTFRVLYEGSVINASSHLWQSGSHYHVNTPTLNHTQPSSMYDATCTSGDHRIGTINAELVESDKIRISWPELNCPGDYVVRYWVMTNKANTFQQDIVPVGITTYTATNLEPDTEYVFRVMYHEPDDTVTTKFWKSSPTFYISTDER